MEGQLTLVALGQKAQSAKECCERIKIQFQVDLNQICSIYNKL
jgi:hypothetical protein